MMRDQFVGGASGVTDNELASWEPIISRYVENALVATKSPGATLAIVTRRGTIFSKAYGYADVGKKIRMTSSSPFNAGSLSKWLTATLLLQHTERRPDRAPFRIDAPLEEYIDEFPLVNNKGPVPVTAQHLLTHTSGLAADRGKRWFSKPEKCGTFVEYLSDIFERERSMTFDGHGSLWAAPVGSVPLYSGIGWAVLGHMLEKLNPGMSFSDCANEYIFAPAGMTETSFPHEGAVTRLRDMKNELVTTYGRFGNVSVPLPVMEAMPYNASGLVTTNDDLARLLTAFLRVGGGGDKEILRPRTLRRMIFPHIDRGEAALGLGSQISNFGKPTVSHGHMGRSNGSWTLCSVFPCLGQDGIAVVAMCNSNDLTMSTFPTGQIVPQLVTRFVTDLVQRSRPLVERAERTPAWRGSFAFALLLIDRMRLTDSVPDRWDSATISSTMGGSWVTNGSDEWDPEGFAAGIEAGNALSSSVDAFNRYLESEECPVGPTELGLARLAAGGDNVSTLPVPFPYFAKRSGEDPRYGYLDMI